mmetsp:Transcript_6333/g.15553  ORF Transcript_6333/g.15553 Transcript_6333/m.15553 type:complete len:80 (+) Transcript_6333:146-385(+)
MPKDVRRPTEPRIVDHRRKIGKKEVHQSTTVRRQVEEKVQKKKEAKEVQKSILGVWKMAAAAVLLIVAIFLIKAVAGSE